MTLHKGTSVVVFRATPGAPREGGVVGGGRTREDGARGEWILSLLLKVRHCPPRHQMSFFLMSLPSLLVTQSHVNLALQGRGVVSPGQRSHDRAEGEGVGWGGVGVRGSSSPIFSVTKRRKIQVFFFLLGGEEKVKVVGSQHVGVHIYPLTLSFSGELGCV